MNGGHDLGGMHGFGPITAEPETQEPVFHAAWEKRVFGLARALGVLGVWSRDMSRFARERQHPAAYLRHTYYENWLAGLELLLRESGLLTAAELASGAAAGKAEQDLLDRRLTPGDVSRALAGMPVNLPVATPPRFKPGDQVKGINRHPTGHTRQPRYVRGRVGVVHEYHGGHLFPDLSARGIRVGRHLYSVCFAARELWGAEADPKSFVYVDLWEDYLEPAQ